MLDRGLASWKHTALRRVHYFVHARISQSGADDSTVDQAHSSTCARQDF